MLVYVVVAPVWVVVQEGVDERVEVGLGGTIVFVLVEVFVYVYV